MYCYSFPWLWQNRQLSLPVLWIPLTRQELSLPYSLSCYSVRLNKFWGFSYCSYIFHVLASLLQNSHVTKCVLAISVSSLMFGSLRIFTYVLALSAINKSSGYKLATCFCQNWNLGVHWQIFITRGFQPFQLTLTCWQGAVDYELARNCRKALVWPASRLVLPLDDFKTGRYLYLGTLYSISIYSICIYTNVKMQKISIFCYS